MRLPRAAVPIRDRNAVLGPFVAVLLAGTALGLLQAGPARAQDATWLGGTDDFGTAGNWSPGAVPTGTASFGAPGSTSVSVSDTRSLSGLTFDAGSPAYTVSVTGDLTFTGAGIINNSSATQTLTVGGGARLFFNASGSAGNATITNAAGVISFNETSTAGTAVITNAAFLNFNNTSTAGTATITNNSTMKFNTTSTAGSATINNDYSLNFSGTSTADSATITNHGILNFNDTSTAGAANINNFNYIYFFDTSTAGSVTITNNDYLGFYNTSTAGSATITNNDYLGFYMTSTAGNARLVTTATGTTDFSPSTGPAGNGKLTAGSIAGAGAYILGANELTVGGNNLSTKVSGVISGAGGALTKTGSGTFTLTGINTYTGPTTVSAGKLIVGDDATPNASLASAVTVKTGATLGGRGSVGTTVIESGGTLAPGASAMGNLTVNGNLTFNTGSHFQVEVNPAGADSDLVAVNGTAYLGGSVAHIGAGGTYRPSSTYTILTATGGVNGHFDGVTSNFAFLDPELSYGTNDVLLTLKRNDIAFGSYANAPNQLAIAGGVESLDPANPLYQAIVSLAADAPTIRGALDGLSGEVHASAKGMLIEDSHFVRDVASERIRAALGDGGVKSLPVMAYGEGAPKLAPADTDRLAAWGRSSVPGARATTVPPPSIAPPVAC